MKVVQRVGIVCAVALIAGWASSSSACDKDKASASAAHASGTCTAGMAKACTPEMAAACKARMSAAVAQASPGTVNAVVASANSPCAMGAKVSAVAASASGKDGCCAGKASAMSASAHGSCAMKNAAAGQCAAHGMGVMAAASMPGDCEACIDASTCNDALEAAAAHRQAVCLRNGVMYVFTADTQRNVSAVQAAVARRDERMARIALAGENAHLCQECKALRGAIASGKLSREVINIEGGALTLITSTDPATVAKLHAMAEPKLAARVKI